MVVEPSAEYRRVVGTFFPSERERGKEAPQHLVRPADNPAVAEWRGGR
jgi:hypothetical protein